MKNLWKDPVWSKVISAIIIAVGAFLISLVYSLITELSVKDSILHLWKYEILLGPTILIIIIIYFLISVIKSIIKCKSSKTEKLEDKFHKEFNKIVSIENKTTYRFNAFISSLNDLPFISEFRVYCNNHETEVLMSPSQGCNRQGCFHYNVGYNKFTVKQEIETYLLIEWEKINGTNL